MRIDAKVRRFKQVIYKKSEPGAVATG